MYIKAQKLLALAFPGFSWQIYKFIALVIKPVFTKRKDNLVTAFEKSTFECERAFQKINGVEKRPADVINFKLYIEYFANMNVYLN